MIPGLKLVSEANASEHWRVKAKRVAQQKLVVTGTLNRIQRPTLPVHVEITRIAPRMLDSDNLQGAAKAVRDAIARWLCVDDADWKATSRVTWEVRQETGGVRQYAVRIVMREVKA
jgi:hypothetical protein